MEIDAYLWSLYQDPYFIFSNEPYSKRYAIITGWNRFGKKQSHQDNLLQNEQLLASLPNVEVVGVLVGNDDFSWYEESYAIAIEKDSARELAKKYAQNAIYFVEKGELTLLSCLDERETPIGQIKARCVEGFK
ncbi:DUF3293 domain-containing protein [Vibrio sp. ZSDE26]|uniref:DUF3293 domain-containing protein n=1 Tax=Vibrio amylolyticus TaxID=2847292 RepID=A0A9X1XIT2_9VIBR|nr:DUF3293 domain-containing protein [Vibrio amylolyticus]MCK6262423.1 DUF3293 domain-containing protein [Vibrio amylolyticus]